MTKTGRREPFALSHVDRVGALVARHQRARGGGWGKGVHELPRQERQSLGCLLRAAAVVGDLFGLLASGHDGSCRGVFVRRGWRGCHIPGVVHHSFFCFSDCSVFFTFVKKMPSENVWRGCQGRRWWRLSQQYRHSALVRTDGKWW